MNGSVRDLEPAYSNLIEHFDMKHVKVSTRFIADCIRYAKNKGVGDSQLEEVFMRCVADFSDRPLQEAETQTVGAQFREQIDRIAEGS